MTRGSRFGAEIECEWVRLYEEGATAAEIGAEYFAGLTTVYGALRRRGAKMRGPGRVANDPKPPVEPLNDEERAMVLALRRGGMNMTEIALTECLPYALVRAECRARGLGGRR